MEAEKQLGTDARVAGRVMSACYQEPSRIVVGLTWQPADVLLSCLSGCLSMIMLACYLTQLPPISTHHSPPCSADEVVVSADGADLPAAVKAATGGKPAYAAIECVGGELFGAVASSVRDHATVILYGAMSGLSASFSIPDLLFRGVVARGFWLNIYLHRWVAVVVAVLGAFPEGGVGGVGFVCMTCGVCCARSRRLEQCAVAACRASIHTASPLTDDKISTK